MNQRQDLESTSNSPDLAVFRRPGDSRLGSTPFNFAPESS
jgi:hypothetical protein